MTPPASAAGSVPITATDDDGGTNIMPDGVLSPTRSRGRSARRRLDRRLRRSAVKLLTKLTLLALAVSALPVAIAGYFSLRIGQRALRGALEQNELRVAKQVAGYASSHIENILSMLRVDARILDLTRSAQNEPPSPQALNQVLWLVYHQNDDFCAVAMFDEHGALIGKPASLEDPSRYASLKNHEPMRPTDVEGVGLMAPLGAALSSGQGIGPIFLGGPLRLPHVVLAVAFDPSYGGGKRILAAEVSLKRLANYVATLSTPDTDVKLLDGRGRLFAAGSSPRVDKLEPQRVPGAREGELPRARSSPNTSTATVT